MAEFEQVPDEANEGDEVDESSEAEGVETIEQSAAPVASIPAEPGEGARTFAAPSPSRQLSPHFKLSEFHCRDGTTVPASTVEGLTRLCVDVLEPLREKFGVCNVTSGFRSESHNKLVKGAARSYHRYDLRPGHAAADVKFRTGNPAAWFKEADRILGRGGGAGKYNTFLHVDNRPGRWRS